MNKITNKKSSEIANTGTYSVIADAVTNKASLAKEDNVECCSEILADKEPSYSYSEWISMRFMKTR